MEKAQRVEIGRRLREYRQARGRWLTVRKLGELIGTAHSVVSAIERGARRPPPAYLYKVAPYLRLPPEQLLVLAGYLERTGRWADAAADPLTIIKEQLALLGFNADETTMVVRLIQGMVANRPVGAK